MKRWFTVQREEWNTVWSLTADDCPPDGVPQVFVEESLPVQIEAAKTELRRLLTEVDRAMEPPDGKK